MIAPDKIKKLAVLLDPDDTGNSDFEGLISLADECRVDYFLVGGSTTFIKPGELISGIKKITSVPVYIFPGNLLQLDPCADGILLLSLISGRNPELLIGNHVVAAPQLKKMGVDIVPVGYILVSSGVRSSVEYMSQTEAIPAGKKDIAVATAMAGELLGLKMIYLEAGSGAEYPVPADMIAAVKNNTSIPLIAGGGLRTAADVSRAYSAGADIVVLGNGLAENPALLSEACSIRDSINKKGPA
ncbi:MAG: geranylgeranylglyceryl/heptaprenylglyceryl phosphate synthase [Marinilabiliaceae bacterium]|jgi:putative glycerol-1-phosphate prenyltransferase|nr:geranylgeranylglyceryl/heptaprenylglyceryl phosphate synthase [Marinilabiliaceae bacterium]